MKEIIVKFYEYTQNNYLKPIGLICSYLLIFVVELIVFNNIIDCKFINEIELFIKYKYIIFGLIYLIFFSIITIIWIIKRKLPKFKKEEIGIILAFSDRIENRKYAKRINELIEEKINDSIGNIIKRINVKKIPSHITITKENVNEIREKTKATLIIWKNINIFKDNGKDRVDIKYINFTTKCRSLKELNFLAASASLFDSQKTTYITDNEYTEGLPVIENISLTANIFIAKSLVLAGYYDEALLFFNLILEKPNIKNKKFINNNIDYIYTCKINEIYAKKIYVDGTFNKDKQSLNNIKLLLDKIENKDTSSYKLFKSVILFLEGNYSDAEVNLNNVYGKNKKEQGAIDASKAFIILYRGNLPKAFELLSKIDFTCFDYYQTNHILDFYMSVIEKEKDKYNLFFGYAYINYKCKDILIAKEYFEKFVDYKKNNSVTWKRKAKNFIRKINKKSQKVSRLSYMEIDNEQKK